MTIAIGNRVAYSANWLRSTGQVASANDIGGWRGVVVGIDHYPGLTLATVQWDNFGRSICAPRDAKTVNVKNLARVGTRAMNTD